MVSSKSYLLPSSISVAGSTIELQKSTLYIIIAAGSILVVALVIIGVILTLITRQHRRLQRSFSIFVSGRYEEPPEPQEQISGILQYKDL